MTTRTDIHRPSALVTEDYEYLYAWDSQQPGCLVGIAHDPIWAEWMGALAPGAESGRCTHCGANIRYHALLRHTPTGETIYVGETCLANRFERASSDFHQLRKQAQLDRQAQKILQAWNECKAANPGVDFDLLATSTNPFIVDVLGKGRRYGSLSEKQVAAIVRAFERDLEHEARKAEREANPVATVAVPTGKGLVITGRLVSRKWKETDFGSVEKCLIVVETPEGEYKVWGSIPSSLYDVYEEGTIVRPGVNLGDLVTLTANVERSGDDASFGFFSRPRKASFVAAVAA